MNLYGVKIIIAEKKPEIANALKKHFSDSPSVEIVRCNISQISSADCIVAPGNSYGLMDMENDDSGNHSVNKTINLLLNDISKRVQNVIENIYYGEQPVGTSFLIETQNQRYKYLAYTPTMQIPSDVNETRNAYYAFRALLTTVLNHNKVNDNKITSILCSSFCTGIGKMDPDVAARQMRLAYGLIDINLNCSWDNANMIDSFLK